MVLLQEQTTIDEHTTHEQLYLPPDEEHRSGVEEELGPQVPEAPPRHQQQQQALVPPQLQAQVTERLNTFEGELRYMQEQYYGLHDTMYLVGSMVTAMNTFFISRYLPHMLENHDAWYADPTP